MSLEKSHKFELIGVIIAVACAAASFVWAAPSGGPDGLLHIYFLDIGQGDAILVQAPDGAQMLIDGGPDRTVLEELGEVLPLEDRELDVVVATHTDADHLSGLADVAERYDVRHIVETGMQCNTATCKRWEEAATHEAGAERVFAHAGYMIELSPEVIFSVISPDRSVQGEKLSKTNNGGIVMKLVYRNQSVLFTADVEKTVENTLVMRGVDVDVDFLKVGHHGSKTSTTEALVDAVTPHAAFISVGARNTYGHPTGEVLGRLAQNEISVYRTDKQGRIELVLDGTNYQIHTEHE